VVFTKKSVQRSNKLFEFASSEAIFLKLLTINLEGFGFISKNGLKSVITKWIVPSELDRAKS